MHCSHCLTLYKFALVRSMEGMLVRLFFSAAFDRVSHRDLLYKLRSIGVGGQVLFRMSKCLSDR